MIRRYLRLPSPAIGREMEVLAYGHHGPPMIAFPSGGGAFHDFEDNGMVDAVAHLLEAGRLKLYCTESLDHETWMRPDVDPYWRGVRYAAFQDYLTKDLVPFVEGDCQTPSIAIALTGCSFGAYHAANFSLKVPERFRYALCMSGRYDLEAITGKSDAMEVYFNNPLAYVHNLHGGDLDRVRRHTFLTLVCGQGAWEDKCLDETKWLAGLLADKGIPHELDLWGHDVEHHWYWWRQQFAYHLNTRLG